MPGRRDPGSVPGGASLGFTEDELDTLLAGLVRLLRDAGLDILDEEEGADAFAGDDLASRAARLLDRIARALPPDASAPPRARKGDGPHHGPIRRAIRAGTKLTLSYLDRRDRASARTVWPLELGAVGAGETLAAWCETRRDFRHFRLDRIRALSETGVPYPGARRILLARLRVAEEEQSW